MSLSKFSFKLPDLSAFGKKLIRSAQDIKSKAVTFFKPRKPVDVSIKAKQEIEVQRIKEAQAARVQEGKISKEEAAKELLQSPTIITRVKSFFQQRFNFFMRKPDPDIIKADVNTKIETVKAEAEVKAKEKAEKERQDYIDANKPNIEANKAELNSTVDNWKNNFLSRLTIVRERIDPEINLKDRVNTAKTDAENAEVKVKDAEAKAKATRAEATKAETKARDAETKVKEIKEKGGTKEDVQKANDDYKKAREDAKKAKAEADKADAEARNARKSSDTAKEKANKVEEDVNSIRQKSEKAAKEKLDKAEADANKAKADAKKAKDDAENAKKKSEEADAEAKKAKEDAETAEVKVKDAEAKGKELKDKGASKEELDKAEADTKKAREDAENAKKKASKADAEAKKAKESAETARQKANKAEQDSNNIREKLEKQKLEKAETEVKRAKDDAENAKKKSEEADAEAKKAKEDAEKAEAKAKKAEEDLENIRRKEGATKEELEKAEADTKKAREDAENAKKKAEEADAKAKKAKEDADAAQQKVNKAEEDLNNLRQKFEKEKLDRENIQKAEAEVKKAKEDAENAKKKSEEADAEAKKAKQEAEELEAKAKKAEEDLENIRRKEGATKEEIEKAEIEAKKAREDAEFAKKKAEEADAKAKKAKEDADAAQKKVTKAEEDLNNIRNKNDPNRIDSDTPKKLAEDFKDTKNTFKEIWKKTETFRQNVKLFAKKIMGVLFMIAVIVLPILLSIFVLSPPTLPPFKPPNFTNPFSTFLPQPGDIWNMGGPGGLTGGPDGPTGGPPANPPNVPLPGPINPSPQGDTDRDEDADREGEFNFQGTITFTLANKPDEDLTFQLKPIYDNLKFDDDIITFYADNWDTPFQTNYYCNIDTSIVDNNAFKNLNTKSKKEYLQKDTYVDKYSLENPTREQIITQKKRLDYLLNPIETLGETLERLEKERKYEEQFQGGEYIEPLYDEDQYKNYEPIVDPIIRNADVMSAKELEQSDTILEEVVDPTYEDGYDDYQGSVIPTQEAGQQEEEYNNIDDLEYDDIAKEVDIDDLDNDFKCMFEIILAQDINYVVGVNIEIDDATLILDPNYLEMDGTNQVGTTYITTSQLINTYQQIYVLNTTNELDKQVKEVAYQQYSDGMDVIKGQEQTMYSNGDMIYQNAYENSLDEDNQIIDDGEFILNALNFDEMFGGSYFLNKFKKTNKTVN